MPRRTESPLPRVVVENITPSVDGGRHPVKRVVGDRLEVGVDVYKDGHDLVAGRVLFRRPPSDGEEDEPWESVPLVYDYAPDRWHANVELDRLGRWQYTVEAWPARFETWCEELRKRRDAGQELGPELLEGALLLERAAARKGEPKPARQALARAARRLRDEDAALEERLEVAFDAEVARLASGPLGPEDRLRVEPPFEVVVDRERAVFGAWYELFPRSHAPEPGRHGTFADAEKLLPRLAGLGFDVVYLPPIHPIGRTHRKGRNNTVRCEPGDPGSPWAIGGREGGHTAVHPGLGTLEDFEHFVEAAKSLGMEVALDYALQCSPDHPWVREHPEWFSHRPDGTIRYAENPPKKYEDIYPLDFWNEDREGLWNACRDVLLFWLERGVRVFRVDNPHTKPFAFWEWMIRDVQRENPDAIFLSEAFTRPKRMYGLAKIGFTQSYTYFTWKNEWWELREYLTELTRSGVHEFYRPNFFANTPDILHAFLQEGGRPAFRIRLLLAGTLSPSYGIYSGFELCENVPVREGSEEYVDSEKYQLRWRDWTAPGNLDEDLTSLNRIRRESPALQRFANLEFLESRNENVLWYRKYTGNADDEIWVAVTTDPAVAQEAMVRVPLAAVGAGPDEPVEVEDLLTQERFVWRGEWAYVRIDPTVRPGHVFRPRVARRAATGGGAR